VQDLGHKALRLALPQLLFELGPDGPPEFPSEVVDEKRETAVEGGKEVTTAITQTIRLGWDAMGKSDHWLCVAVCRWLLESRFDQDSLKHASDESHRHYQANRDLATDPVELDYMCPRFVAGGDFERCVEYLKRCRRFKAPKKPTDVRTERGMAYVMAMGGLGKGWSHEHVQRAMRTFLKIQIPRLLEGGQLLHVALWMMLGVWRGAEKHISPEQALLKAAELAVARH